MQTLFSTNDENITNTLLSYLDKRGLATLSSVNKTYHVIVAPILERLRESKRSERLNSKLVTPLKGAEPAPEVQPEVSCKFFDEANNQEVDSQSIPDNAQIAIVFKNYVANRQVRIAVSLTSFDHRDLFSSGSNILDLDSVEKTQGTLGSFRARSSDSPLTLIGLVGTLPNKSMSPLPYTFAKILKVTAPANAVRQTPNN